MPTTDPLDVVVIGGAAGAVIAQRLLDRGQKVALLSRTDVRGATDTNQKWLHSGLLYPAGNLAARAWANRQSRWGSVPPECLVGSEHGRIVALRPETVSKRETVWAKWKQEGLDIAQWRRLSEAELRDPMFSPFAGGWETPDRVLDFPKLLEHTRSKLHGATVFPEGARVLTLEYPTANKPVVRVGFESNGDRLSLNASHVVMAAGAWCHELLRDLPPESRARIPIIRKKCVVLVYDDELVDRVTVCLDITKDDGNLGDVTLVPYQNQTLAAGNDFKVLYGDQAVEDLRAGDFEVLSLKAELHQCFPGLRGLPCTARVCVKTERFNSCHPDVEPVFYGEKEHGVKGLTVALPGKASLMFDLAETVARHLCESEPQKTAATL